MRILEFEHKHFGVEDMKEILPAMGHELTVISTPLILERTSEEFDKLFDSLIIGNNDSHSSNSHNSNIYNSNSYNNNNIKTIIIAIVILTSTANMMLYLHLTTALSYPTAVTATTSLI